MFKYNDCIIQFPLLFFPTYCYYVKGAGNMDTYNNPRAECLQFRLPIARDCFEVHRQFSLPLLCIGFRQFLLCSHQSQSFLA